MELGLAMIYMSVIVICNQCQIYLEENLNQIWVILDEFSRSGTSLAAVSQQVGDGNSGASPCSKYTVN